MTNRKVNLKNLTSYFNVEWNEPSDNDTKNDHEK